MTIIIILSQDVLWKKEESFWCFLDDDDDVVSCVLYEETPSLLLYVSLSRFPDDENKRHKIPEAP
jgi:hypothetical protein